MAIPSSGSISHTLDAAMASAPGEPAVPMSRVIFHELEILGSDGDIELAVGTNHVRAQIGDIRFTSKLIDGRFPEYGRVIPASPPRMVEADREVLRQAAIGTAVGVPAAIAARTEW